MATNNQSLDVNETLNKSEAFFVKNKKAIIGIGVALIILIGGFFAYRTYVSIPNEEKASTLLAQGQNLFAEGNFDAALNGDSTGFLGLIKLAEKYSSTDAGNLAKLYAGLSYAQKGDANNAIKYIEKFNGSSDHIISPAALGALGNLYAQTGNIDKAIATLKKAAQKANNNSLSPIYLVQAGQLLESQNKPKEAKALYEEVKNKYSRSSEADLIDKYIERVSE